MSRVTYDGYYLKLLKDIKKASPKLLKHYGDSSVAALSAYFCQWFVEDLYLLNPNLTTKDLDLVRDFIDQNAHNIKKFLNKYTSKTAKEAWLYYMLLDNTINKKYRKQFKLKG